MISFIKGYEKESVLAPLFKMLEATFDLLVPLVMADIINVGIAQRNINYILMRSGLLVLLGLVGLVCSITAQYYASKASVGYATHLRHDLFSHIQHLGFSEMDSIGTSTLMTRITSDTNLLQNGVNMFLRLLLRSPFVVFGSVIMAFMIQPKMGWIFIETVIALSVVVFGIMLITMPLYKRVQARLDTLLGLTRENLSGVRVVRAFNKEQDEVEQFGTANTFLTKMQLMVGRISALMNPMTYAVIHVGIIAILLTGGMQVNTGTLRTGDVIALISYMTQVLIELIKLANFIIQMTKSAASAGRIQSILAIKPAMQFGQEGMVPNSQENAVDFSHVSLQYDGAGEESLTDIDFHISCGQTVGIIGGTGSGKSSLVHLLPRFYDATKGEILLFGRPITDYSKEELRKKVGIVMQKAQLFSGTIRSNLLWGKETASDEELWHALDIAQASEFVAQKKQGLDDVLEQGGRNLSGGQKQRLTIARALVKQPSILILDDSASALDFATDAKLRKALRQLGNDITVFIVSQRASSISHADVILVLDDGNLVGMGTHESLLDSCEVYREIYESQFKKAGERV